MVAVAVATAMATIAAIAAMAAIATLTATASAAEVARMAMATAVAIAAANAVFALRPDVANVVVAVYEKLTMMLQAASVSGMCGLSGARAERCKVRA